MSTNSSRNRRGRGGEGAGPSNPNFNLQASQDQANVTQLTWTADDEEILQLSTDLDKRAWRWCNIIYGKNLPDLIPSNQEVDIGENVPVLSSSGKSLEDTRWNNRFLDCLMQAMCLPPFIENYKFLHYAILCAMHYRLGEESGCYLPSPSTILTADEEGEGDEDRHRQPKDASFIRLLKEEVQQGMRAYKRKQLGVIGRDLKAITQAWDRYVAEPGNKDRLQNSADCRKKDDGSYTTEKFLASKKEWLCNSRLEAQQDQMQDQATASNRSTRGAADDTELSEQANGHAVTLHRVSDEQEDTRASQDEERQIEFAANEDSSPCDPTTNDEEEMEIESAVVESPDAHTNEDMAGIENPIPDGSKVLANESGNVGGADKEITMTGGPKAYASESGIEPIGSLGELNPSPKTNLTQQNPGRVGFGANLGNVENSNSSSVNTPVKTLVSSIEAHTNAGVAESNSQDNTPPQSSTASESYGAPASKRQRLEDRIGTRNVVREMEGLGSSAMVELERKTNDWRVV
ncbi:hypothetical protein BTUL_0136g00200 [Botrytis tulipae]|uniref:Uncharacterized protein n=1 Tax=Botrytis tulipae TaxID=87230 RepID=A0A4Z1EIL5_9HELO|nr:hypothetical protein BTUL_0136g00200 [Botrytis tulipae]